MTPMTSTCADCGATLVGNPRACYACGAGQDRDIAATLRDQPSAYERFMYGAIKPALTCPHCGEKGRIHVLRVTRKKGVSGAKATAPSSPPG